MEQALSVSALTCPGRSATYFQSLLRRTALQLSFTNSLGREEVCQVQLVADLITEGSNNRLVPVMRVLSGSNGRFGVDYRKEMLRFDDLYMGLLSKRRTGLIISIESTREQDLY